MLVKQTNIVYVTCCENGFYGLRHLYQEGFKIEKVITISKILGKKYNVSGYKDPSHWCDLVGIEVIKLDDYTVKISDIENSSKQILVVNGWNRLINLEVINAFKIGALGVHAGHPPIGMGRAPLPWNIIKGFKDIEVYVFKLTDKADDGNILGVNTIEITTSDDIKTLYEKVMFRSAKLFAKAIISLENRKKGFEQAKQFEITYPKRSPSDGLIDFRRPVEELVDFVRAQTYPYPGAFSFLNKNKWSIWKAQSFDSHSFRTRPRIPGQIVLALPSGLVVQTGSAPLWITSATQGENVIAPNSLEFLEKFIGQKFDN